VRGVWAVAGGMADLERMVRGNYDGRWDTV
jgi:hypothetical protein